eukprot:SAG11_NODE_17704_length_511_cov_0.752427_1_plen_32_part_01
MAEESYGRGQWSLELQGSGFVIDGLSKLYVEG